MDQAIQLWISCIVYHPETMLEELYKNNEEGVMVIEKEGDGDDSADIEKGVIASKKEKIIKS